MLEIINGFISSAIQTISLYCFGYHIVREKNYNKKEIVYDLITILVSVILHTFIFVYLKGTIKTIVLCGLFMITFRILFNTTYTKSLLSAIIYIVILIIPDLIVTGVGIYILGMEKHLFYSNIAGTIIGNIFVNIVMIIVIHILKKPLRKIINYSLPTNKKIIVVAFFTLVSLALFFYSLIKTFEFSNNITSNLVVIITLILILFYLFKQKMENDSISKKYDDLLNIMKNYESDIEEQRTMIHETRNEFMTIKSKISDKEKESSIIKYIDSILGDKVSSNMSKYSKFMYLPSNGIKGFFYYKFMEAEKKGIKVSVNISKKIENSFLSKLETKDFKDLVRIVGVYLDNAIEASTESKDKKLGIEIYMIKDDIEIIISNTFINKIDPNKLGIEKFTTKGKLRGHGLLLVNYILRSNPIFESSKEITKNIYSQTLKINNIK